MMKKYLLLVTLSFLSVRLGAQQLTTILLTRRAVLKSLSRQLAMMRVYDSLKTKGYSLAEAGLDLVSGSRSRLLWLHRDYYSSLVDIPSAVGEAGRAGLSPGALSLLGACYSQCIKQLPPGSRWLVPYVRQVFSALCQSCTGDLSILESLTREGAFAMDPAARLRYVQRLRCRIKDRLAFAASFTGMLILMTTHRQSPTPQA